MTPSRFLVAPTGEHLPPEELVKKIMDWCERISDPAELVTGPEPGISRYFDYLATERKWIIHYADGTWEERLEGKCECHQEVKMPRMVLVLTSGWSEDLANLVGQAADRGIQSHIWPFRIKEGAEAPPENS